MTDTLAHETYEIMNITRLDSIDSFKIINPNIESDNLANTNDLDINMQNMINIYMEPDKIYTSLLDEIYETINDNNQLFSNTNINISKPDIEYSNRKTFWNNYGKNCFQLNRTLNQIKIYFEKELAVETSINDKKQLILRGNYNFNLVASTLKKYIKNYVQCSACKSILSEIVRNTSNRLDYLKCLNSKCNTCKVVIKI